MIEDWPARWAIAWGVVLAIIGAIGWRAGLRLGAGVQALSFVGLALFMVGVIAARHARRVRIVRGLIVIGAVVGTFTLSTFTGYGRLILVALALAPIVLLASQAKTRAIKALTIAGVPISLAVFGLMRERFSEQRFGVSAPDAGIGSTLSPLRDFAALLRLGQDGAFEWGGGETFVATLVFPVPRSIWPEKPVGFGSDLTAIIHPELVQIGHSAAALVHGELYFNFGLLGIIALVGMLALLIRWFDRMLLSQTSGKTVLSPREMLQLMAVLVLVADLPNLLWVGTFGYVSRTGSRLVVLAALLLVAPRASVRRRGRVGSDTITQFKSRPTS